MSRALALNLIIIGSLMAAIGGECCAPLMVEPMSGHCSHCYESAGPIISVMPSRISSKPVVVPEFLAVAGAPVPVLEPGDLDRFRLNSGPSVPLLQNPALRI